MPERRVSSRLTSMGWGALGVAGLTTLAALSTTNNLLYLLFSGVVSALLVSWIAGRWNLRRLSARARFPDQVFRGDPFRMTLALCNEGTLPVLGVWVREAWVERLDAGARTEVEVPFRFIHRGRNAAAGLSAESLFPLGLFLHRRALPEAVGTAYPKPREIHCPAEITADASFSGRPLPKKGRGDELYGIREYTEADDSRLINWKLSAKAGKALVNEYCLPGDSRVTIRVGGVGAGDEAERSIAEAASAFRYYVDTGTEVRLLTPEGSLDYGKGLLHLDKALRLLAELGEGKSPRPSRVAFAAGRGVADSAALRRLNFFGAGLVYAGLFLIDEIDARLLAALSPIIPLGWALHELKAWRPPKLVWDALSLTVLSYVVAFGWRLAGIVLASVHLVLYLLANRVLNELKTAELGQFLLILLLGAFFVSGLAISPWYFLFFILFSAFCGTWLSLACGLSCGSRRRWLPALAGLAAPWAVAAGLLFVLSPRTEGLRRLNPFVAMGIDKLQIKGSAVAGFTERISLGWYGEIRKSTARVMRIRPLSPPAGGRTSDSPGPILVRGAALDTFDGRAWTKGKVDFKFEMDGRTLASASGRGWAARAGEQVVFPAEDGPLLPELEFNCYPMNLSVIFTVGSLAAVRLPTGAASFDHTDTAYFSSPYTGGMRFISSQRQAPLGFGRRIRGYDKLLRERFLQLPSGEDPRVGDLARRLTAKAAGDEAKARAIVDYLHRSYRYSTFSDSPGKGLPEFLFQDRKGNCEYFATAGTILLRHLGIPSRFVAGFLAEDWNEYGRFYDVRQGSAHAWTEAYIGGRWVTLDPTPPAGFSQAADAFYKRFARLMSALEMKWYQQVIGYDAYVQRNTFFRLSQVISPERLRDLAKALALPAGLAAAAAACALGVWRLRGRRRRAPRTLFERAQALLDGAGLPREAHLTPLEHARRVEKARPELAGMVPLVELHYLERYRGSVLDTAQRQRAERLLADLDLALRHSS